MTPTINTRFAIVACLLTSVAHLTAAANVAPSFTLTVGYGQTNGTAIGAWGKNDAGETNVPPDLTNVVAISAGYQHSLALRADGTVVA
jgi:Regulator of chromosome condensation (RCC1) repeat